MEDRVSRLCYGLCTNVEGSYLCHCPLGYRIAPDGRTCQGIGVLFVVSLRRAVETRERKEIIACTASKRQ